MAIIGTDLLSHTLATLRNGYLPPLTRFSDDAERRQFAWALTRVITDGRAVRVYDRGVDGTILNSAPMSVQSDDPAAMPDTTWALRLFTSDLPRLVGFDFDVKKGSIEQAERDCLELRALCTRFGINTVMFRSGGGGFHLWLRLVHDCPSPFTAAELKQLSVALRILFPTTIDVGPITNPRTGCLRAPYAPHRSETAYSEPYSDEEPANVLLKATTQPEQMRSLLDEAQRLADVIRVEKAATSPLINTRQDFELVKTVDYPARAMFRMRGERKAEIPKFIQQLVSGGVVISDHSERLLKFFTSAVRARWSYDEAMQFGRQHPELIISALTRPRGESRQRRSDANADAYSRHVWTQAVSHVEATWRTPMRQTEERALSVELRGTLLEVEHAWERFTARQQYFARAGLTRYLTYSAILNIMLRAMRTEVAAATREVAVMVGSNRTSVARALKWLVKENWLIAAKDPNHETAKEQGRSTAPIIYQLPLLSTAPTVQSLTLVSLNSPAPLSDSPASFEELWERREVLREEIERIFEVARSDVFTLPRAGGIGKLAGMISVLLERASMTAKELAQTLELTVDYVRSVLEKMKRHKLVCAGEKRRKPHDESGKWSGVSAEWRKAVVSRNFKDAKGTLAARARRYTCEQKIWQWTLNELYVRSLKLKDRPAAILTYQQLKSLGTSVFPAWPKFPTYMVQPDDPGALPQRRMDLKMARLIVFTHFIGVAFHDARAA